MEDKASEDKKDEINNESTLQTTIINESRNKKFEKKFKIPEMKSILKWKFNPICYEPVVADWVQTIFEYSLLDEEKFRTVRSCVVFADYMYPHCNVERFELAIKAILMITVIDEHFESTWGDMSYTGNDYKKVFNEIKLGLKKIAEPDMKFGLSSFRPYTLFLFAIHNDICINLSEASKKRFLRLSIEYCEGSIREGDVKRNKMDFKDVNEVMKLRLECIWVFPGIMLIEYLNDINLTDEEFNDPVLQNIILLAANCCVVINDILSFEKELIEQGNELSLMMNVVAWTVICDKCSVEKALEKVSALYMTYESDLMKSIQTLHKSNKSANMKAFADYVEYYVGVE